MDLIFLKNHQRTVERMAGDKMGETDEGVCKTLLFKIRCIDFILSKLVFTGIV